MCVVRHLLTCTAFVNLYFISAYEDGLTKESLDIVRAWLTLNQRGPVLDEQEAEVIMPLLSSVHDSRINAEKLERLSSSERASMLDYEERLTAAKAPEVAVLKRFGEKTDPLQKNKFGPVFRHRQCRDMLIFAMQFRFHFRGSPIFQEKWWNKTLQYGSVSNGTSHAWIYSPSLFRS